VVEKKRKHPLLSTNNLCFVVKHKPKAAGLADERWHFEEGVASMYALVLCAPGACACVHGSECIRADQTCCEQASFVRAPQKNAERGLVFTLFYACIRADQTRCEQASFVRVLQKNAEGVA
jgi:hypothetical protein